MEQLEIELKFFMSDPNSLRGRLAALGAECLQPRTFEHNVRYETADDRLLETGCLLRLRKDHTTKLTFKAPPDKADPRFKVARELEVQVDDFATMDAILKALGFSAHQVYQKWRETWHADGVAICLDTMPFGHFLELEGAPDAIMAMIAVLELEWRHRILDTYLGIFARLRTLEGWPFTDVSFDNFKSVDIRFEDHRRRFEVGDQP